MIFLRISILNPNSLPYDYYKDATIQQNSTTDYFDSDNFDKTQLKSTIGSYWLWALLGLLSIVESIDCRNIHGTIRHVNSLMVLSIHINDTKKITASSRHHTKKLTIESVHYNVNVPYSFQ